VDEEQLLPRAQPEVPEGLVAAEGGLLFTLRLLAQGAVLPLGGRNALQGVQLRKVQPWGQGTFGADRGRCHHGSG